MPHTFQRISLRKGEMKKVELTVPYTELQVWDEKQNRFILPDKEMTLEIGASSSDIRLRTTFRTEE